MVYISVYVGNIKDKLVIYWWTIDHFIWRLLLFYVRLLGYYMWFGSFFVADDDLKYILIIGIDNKLMKRFTFQIHVYMDQNKLM